MSQLDQQSCHAWSSFLRRQETKVSTKILQSSQMCTRDNQQASVKAAYRSISPCRDTRPLLWIAQKFSAQSQHYQIGISILNPHTIARSTREFHMSTIRCVPRSPVGPKKLRAESRQDVA